MPEPRRADRETVFTVEATPIKFGAGAVADAGWELARLGVRRALLVTDPGVVRGGHAGRVAESAAAAGIEVVEFDGVRIEPTLASLETAVEFARKSGADGVLSVGGGSAIDTAKVVNLLTRNEGEVMDYVNRPVGGGRAPEQALLPHLAIPTTAGTGSEATTVAVLDIPELEVKSGISHRMLRPSQAIVDPELTRTLGPEVTASAGLDVVCHAAESFTARPFDSRERPGDPAERPPYQGANPVADVWSARALEIGGRYLRRAVRDSDDIEARGMMMLAATMAGVGFGSAGVHIPHACAYPIAGRAHRYRPAGYPDDHPFIPHGLSVIVTAPAAFRFTAQASPERHAHAAALLAGDAAGSIPDARPTADRPDAQPIDGDPGAQQTADRPGARQAAGHPRAQQTAGSPDALAREFERLIADLGAPASLGELGYTVADIPDLVEGALAQRRLLAIAPRDPDADDLAEIFRTSLA